MNGLGTQRSSKEQRWQNTQNPWAQVFIGGVNKDLLSTYCLPSTTWGRHGSCPPEARRVQGICQRVRCWGCAKSDTQDETKVQKSQSFPELHRHGGVSHPCSPQPTRLHAVLCLVQEVDKTHTRAILAEYVGHLWQQRVRKKSLLGTHEPCSPPSSLCEVLGWGWVGSWGRESHLDPAASRPPPRGPGGHMVLSNDGVSVSCQQPDVQLIDTHVQPAVFKPGVGVGGRPSAATSDPISPSQCLVPITILHHSLTPPLCTWAGWCGHTAVTKTATCPALLGFIVH